MKRKLLIVRNSALGEVAMTIPVAYSLAAAYPDLEICFLTRPLFAKLFINPPANLRVIAADFKGEYKGFGGLMRLLSALGKEKFTDVADFHDILRSWVIDAYMRLRGARVRKVDKDRMRRINLIVDKQRQKPYIQRYVDVLSRLGFSVPLSFESLDLSTVEAPAIEVKQPAVGVAPFARYENKAYPAGLMRQVVEMLCAGGASVYLFGGKGREQEIMEHWSKTIDGCHNVAGKVSLEQELLLMSQMRCMVTMDSANQHLSSLAGARVISVWGGTAPFGGYMAYGQKPDDAIYLGLECQPCSVAGSDSCPRKNMQCLAGIKPSVIADKAMQAIAEAKSFCCDKKS